jgi:alpha-D-xyloside xylohydrolase
MRILSWQRDARSLLMHTDDGLLSLAPCSPRTVRVRYTLEAELSHKGSLTVTVDPATAATVPFDVVEDASGLEFSTKALRISIDRSTGAFTYRTPTGELLVREPARGGKHLDSIEVRRSVFDAKTVVEQRSTVDGVRVDARDVRQVVDRRACHTKLEFAWAPGEALYGLGSHEEGMFDLRGKHQYLYQQNLKAVVPVIVSTRGYGVFVDCTSLMTFHDDPFGSYLWGDVDEELDFYFIAGPEFDHIVSELRRLTGEAPMPPKWSFGYLQSKERYESQAELLEVARDYRARDLPLDCVVLDWKSWSGEDWGQKTLDPERFPDPGGMTRQLHELGVRLMVSIWPVMRAGGADWLELAQAGHLLGNRATYDAFSRDARAMYWDQAERGLFSQGVDAWWSDCTEPFEADWTGALKPEPEERLRINTDEAKRYLDPEYINAYSLLHSEGIWVGQRSATSQKRILNLTRSAFLGQQRFGTVTWSGDVTATWETLRRQVAEGLSFCATGMPYWTTDVGGFFVGRRPDLWFWDGDFDAGVADLGYRELYLRWFQYAAWLPMLRSHGTDTPREIWRFGEPGEPVYDALVEALRLRYRLLPYIYSMAGWTTQRAYTMLRALAFDFRADPSVHEVSDEFMFGPAFLVCPVVRPIRFGPQSRPLEHIAPTRQVRLPEGADWFDLGTDRVFEGGQTLEVDLSLEHIPVYVRAGSIVPMGPVRQHVDDAPDAALEVHVYPGRDGAFTLYEDEGDGYAYETGAFATTDLTWDDATRRLTIGERIGRYRGMAPEREAIVIVHAAAVGPRETSGGPAIIRTVQYDGRSVVVPCSTAAEPDRARPTGHMRS